MSLDNFHKLGPAVENERSLSELKFSQWNIKNQYVVGTKMPFRFYSYREMFAARISITVIINKNYFPNRYQRYGRTIHTHTKNYRILFNVPQKSRITNLYIRTKLEIGFSPLVFAHKRSHIRMYITFDTGMTCTTRARWFKINDTMSSVHANWYYFP